MLPLGHAGIGYDEDDDDVMEEDDYYQGRCTTMTKAMMIMMMGQMKGQSTKRRGKQSCRGAVHPPASFAVWINRVPTAVPDAGRPLTSFCIRFTGLQN